MAKNKDRESAIQQAIADFESGKFKSKRAAANAYGLPFSTFKDRVNGSKPRATAHEKSQRLTPVQEEFLVDWIIDLDSMGLSPTIACTRDMAQRILRMNNDQRPLGQDWIK